MRIRSVLPALGLAAAASVYLWALLDIRVAYQTTYNDFFAIPVTVLVILGSLIEVGRTLRRRHDPLPAGAQERQWRPLGNPRVRVAVLLVAYLAGFGRVPFVPWTTAFLVLAVVALQPNAREANGQRGPAFLSVVAAAALGLSTILYLAFSQLGARL